MSSKARGNRRVCNCCGEYYWRTSEETKRKKAPFNKICDNESCIEEGISNHLEKHREKKAKEKSDWNKGWKERKKEYKSDIKKLSAYEKELTDMLQKLARWIDKDLPCPCTGKFHEAYDGGHVLSKGAFSNLKYNMHNIHKCSVYSNQYRGGDEIRFKLGLKKRYGKDYYETKIESLISKYPVLKLSRSELQEKKKIASQIIRNWDAMPMTRDQINTLLGIYK